MNVENKNKKMGKFLSYILRHHPEAIGICLDKHGWANVDELISKIEGLDFELLKEIVALDNKQRYTFNEEQTKIRANQGHSIQVDVELDKKTPPDILYHGTATQFVSSIDEMGLISKTRLYVHLSKDIDTAIQVGSRHGKVVIYEVNCKQMTQDGYTFFQSKNGVWLTKEVPSLYLKKIIVCI